MRLRSPEITIRGPGTPSADRRGAAGLSAPDVLPVLTAGQGKNLLALTGAK